MRKTRRNFLNSSAFFAAACSLAPQKTMSLPVEGKPALDSAEPGLQPLLPRLPAPVHLELTDLTALTGDEQTLLVSLQGLVNRDRPSIYTLLRNDPTEMAWLQTLGVPHTTIGDPWKLLKQYRHIIRGAIVYDTNLPDTINLASSLASLENAVVASPALAAQWGLPVIHDFTGQFANKLDAYNWAIDQLWPRLNHELLIGISPSNTISVPGVQWTTLLKVDHPVADASNRATYTADLTAMLGGEAVYVRYQDAYSSDGWGPSVDQVTILADGQPIASFQPGTSAEQPFLYDADSSSLASAWRFADGNSYFIYRFVPPSGTRSLTLQTHMWNEYLVTATNQAPEKQVANPFFRDYMAAFRGFVFWLDPLIPAEASLFGKILSLVEPDTPYLGWFPGGHEAPGVTLCSQHGVIVAAADFFTNPTVFAGAQAPVYSHQPAVPVPTLENKIYVTLTMSEGDNIQYDQHRMRSIWDDPQRGKVPTNWSISPLLKDAAPSMLSYYQQTQTANDFLVAGPSGVGYTYPSQWSASDLHFFTEATGQYMASTGMNVIYALNRQNDTDLPFTDQLAQQFQQDIALTGILYNWESKSQVSFFSGLPVVTQIGVGSVKDAQTALTNAAAAWNGSQPLFVALGVLAWNMQPADLQSLASSLDARFQIVRADIFFELLKRSSGA